MDRVKVPSGSVQNLETVFDDLQTLVNGNLKKRIDALTGTNGIINALNNGQQVSSNSSLKIGVTNPRSMQLTINPGVGILADGSIILVETGSNVILGDIYSGTIVANAYYQIHIKYKEVGTDPIVAMNAFMFDKTGLTPYSERFSRWSDSYQLIAYLRVTGTDVPVADDEIPLTIIKISTIATEIDETSFIYTGPVGQALFQDVPSIDFVIDIRKEYTYRLDHDVLSDALLVFKDRDSTGTNKINGSIEAVGLLANTLTISGISTLATTNISGLLTIENSNASYANIKSGDDYNAGIIFGDSTSTAKGYIVFDYNNTFIVGFDSTLGFPGQALTSPSSSLVVTSDNFIGNYTTPTVELDLKNKGLFNETTIIKLTNVSRNISESSQHTTAYKFGVDWVGYGKGFFQPVTNNYPFEFLDSDGNYVFKIDTANRNATAYSLQVDNLATLSSAVINLVTTTTFTADTATISNANINDMVLSGLSILNNNVSGIDLPGTSATEFRVGVGSAEYPSGRAVILADNVVNTPSNFRIYDVNPTDNRKESNSYIRLKWNWDGLNGVKQNDNEIVFNTITITGEILNLTSAAAAIRQVYFTSSGKTYNITSYNATTRTIVLETNYTAADIISDVYPVKIIDPYVTYYTIHAFEFNKDGQRRTNRLITIHLDDDNIAKDPEHTMKLELGKRWSLSIRAGNNTHKSPYVTMLPSTYDPDHTTQGQVIRGYSSPFYNVLPSIDGAIGASTAALTLTAHNNGFRIDIEGWESDERETNPHEFEVGYTTLSGITWDTEETNRTRKSGTTFIRTVNRTLQISTNRSTEWTVGVRPIQNNHPVGVPILSTVLSGGGGIPPNDSIVVGPMPFNIMVTSGIIVELDTPNTYIVSGLNNEMWGEESLAGEVIIINGLIETRILSNTLRFEES